MRGQACERKLMVRALHPRWPYRRSHCRHDLHWLVRVRPHRLPVLARTPPLGGGFPAAREAPIRE